MVNFFRTSTLKGRLRFWISFFILLSVFVNFIPIYLIEKKHNETEAISQLEEITKLEHDLIQNWFDLKLSDIKVLSKLPVARKLEMERMFEAYTSYIGEHREFTSIVFVNKEGEVIFDTEGEPIKKIYTNDREYFKEGLKGNSYISNITRSKNTGKPYVIFSSPIFDYGNNVQGVVFGTVSIEKVNEFMSMIRVGNTGKLFLIERNGHIISLSYKTPETNQKDIKQSTLVNSYIYKQALMDKQVNTPYDDLLGNKVYGKYQWVNNGKWLIVAETDFNEVFSTFYRNGLIMIIIVSVLLLVGFLLMLRVSNQIEYPIRQLVHGSQRLKAGHYDYRIEEDKTIINSTSELKELCDTFNEMVATIKVNIESLEQSEERYRSLIELSPEGVIVIMEDVIVFANEQAVEMLGGTDVNDLIGKKYSDFVPQSYLNKLQSYVETLQTYGERRKTIEFQLRRLDGSAIEVSVGSTIINIDGKPAILGVVRDITERKRAQRKLQKANELLKHLATIDGLTGIRNRRSFDEAIEETWALTHKTNETIAIFLLDIDSFKAFNDTYGHIAGDECLKSIATTLNDACNQHNGKVYRYGGEEFVVILNDNEEKAEKLAKEILQAVTNLEIPHKMSSVSNVVTISMGIFISTYKHHLGVKELIEEADKALYLAKQNGKNQYIIRK